MSCLWALYRVPLAIEVLQDKQMPLYLNQTNRQNEESETCECQKCNVHWLQSNGQSKWRLFDNESLTAIQSVRFLISQIDCDPWSLQTDSWTSFCMFLNRNIRVASSSHRLGLLPRKT